ncbi:MAG: hypothetical protein CR979_02630 [Propionibacterium sp.]|nr:MAG: hypothetical protein CR979_02630 [Propionibacterium sp.]
MAGALAPIVAAVSGGPLRGLLDIAIEGYKQLPGAKESAAAQLTKSGNHEAAINSLVLQHIALAGAQGFVTNLGGFVTGLVAIPANIAGMAVIQCRMVAAVAHLRGYDLDDNRVRSAILACLLGEKRVTELIVEKKLPSTPLGIATAPMFDADLDYKIAEYVMADVMTVATGKRIGVLFTKKIPVVGGGVGLVVDGWGTQTVAKYARDQFRSRRVG